MITREEKNAITSRCGEYLLRTVKNYRFYGYFRKNYAKRAKNFRLPRTSFINSINKLIEVVEKDSHSPNFFNNEYYNFAMSMTNLLLHVFVEERKIDPMYMSMFVKDIFENTCYSLFGDNFLQEINFQQNQMMQIPLNERAKHGMEQLSQREQMLFDYWRRTDRKEGDSFESFYHTFDNLSDEEVFARVFNRPMPQMPFNNMSNDNGDDEEDFEDFLDEEENNDDFEDAEEDTDRDEYDYHY